MRNIGILFIFTILLQSCSSDNGDTAAEGSFIRFYGGSYIDEGLSLKQLPDNNYLAVVSFTNEEQVHGGRILKLNATGEVLWEYETIDSLDLTINNLIVNDDNSIVWVGNGVNPVTNNIDIVLGKLDGSGQFVWKKYSGGIGNQHGNAICKASDEGYVIGGSTDKNGGKNIYLQKFNIEGDSLWVRTYFSTGEDEVRDLCEGHNEGFVITGKYGSGLYSLVGIEVNPNGILLDVYNYEGDGVGNEIVKTQDGYIIVGTAKNEVDGENDVFVVKTGTSIREIEWQETFGGVNVESGNSVCVNNDGSFTVAGETESIGAGNRDAYVLNISSNGTKMIEKTFGSSADEWVNSVIQTADYGFGLLGATEFTDNRMVSFIKLNGNYEQE
jgi:hypothetical protein